MTTIYDHETFYQNLKNAILETIEKKNILFSLLTTQPDIIQRKDALVDMLTIFSLQESVVIHSGMEVSSLDSSIKDTIADYYKGSGDNEVIGRTPTDRMLDELLDIAYIIQPKFPASYFSTFMGEVGLTKEDKGDVNSAGFDVLVIGAILVIIKSEMLIIEASEMFKAAPKERRVRGKESGIN